MHDTSRLVNIVAVIRSSLPFPAVNTFAAVESEAIPFPQLRTLGEEGMMQSLAEWQPCTERALQSALAASSRVMAQSQCASLPLDNRTKPGMRRDERGQRLYACPPWLSEADGVPGQARRVPRVGCTAGPQPFLCVPRRANPLDTTRAGRHHLRAVWPSRTPELSRGGVWASARRRGSLDVKNA